MFVGRARCRRSTPSPCAGRRASGTKTTAKPGGAHAQRPVDVLDVGEEPLVEEPDALDRRARDRHRGPVGAADVAQLVEAVGALPKPVAPAGVAEPAR